MARRDLRSRPSKFAFLPQARGVFDVPVTSDELRDHDLVHEPLSPGSHGSQGMIGAAELDERILFRGVVPISGLGFDLLPLGGGPPPGGFAWPQSGEYRPWLSSRARP